MAIHFFSEEVPFSLKEKQMRKKWLSEIASMQSYKIRDLNYIFCSDEYLHKINLEYLNHDDYTDIITFDNSENPSDIEGDIYISIERVNENAEKYQLDQNTELSRVISHGLFHLMGQKDKTKNDSKAMRSKEAVAILLFEKLKCST